MTGYYLDLLTSETMRLLGSNKSKITKDENCENMSHLEITELILVHGNIVKSDCLQHLRILYIIVSNKSIGWFQDISPKSFIFFRNFNLEFSYIEVSFTDQNSRGRRYSKYHLSYQLKCKIWKIMSYLVQPTDWIFVKGYELSSFPKNMGEHIGKYISKNLSGQYGLKFLDHAKKSGTDALKTSSKRVIKKTAEAAGDFIEYKIANKITKFSKNSQKANSEIITDENDKEKQLRNSSGP